MEKEYKVLKVRMLVTLATEDGTFMKGMEFDDPNIPSVLVSAPDKYVLKSKVEISEEAPKEEAPKEEAPKEEAPVAKKKAGRPKKK